MWIYCYSKCRLSCVTYDHEVTEEWKEYFDEYLNGTTKKKNLTSRKSNPASVANEEMAPVAVPVGRIKDAVKQLRNNKSAAEDSIRAELVWMNQETRHHRLIIQNWDQKKPEDWSYPLDLRESWQDCENHRAIHHQNVAEIISRWLLPLENRVCGKLSSRFRLRMVHNGPNQNGPTNPPKGSWMRRPYAPSVFIDFKARMLLRLMCVVFGWIVEFILQGASPEW